MFEPYRLVDADGVVLVRAAAYFRELAACGRPAAMHRSYGDGLAALVAVIWAVECPWDEATRVEAREFCSWIQLADKPVNARALPPYRQPSRSRHVPAGAR